MSTRITEAGPQSPYWEWEGARFTAGYGAIQVEGKTRRAHRIVYETVRGPIPDGLVLDHLCRNRICVNPWHLEPVTLVENILRGESPMAGNAKKTHCIHGHEFTAENTHIYNNARICLACRRNFNLVNARIYRAKRRAAK